MAFKVNPYDPDPYDALYTVDVATIFTRGLRFRMKGLGLTDYCVVLVVARMYRQDT